MQEIPCPFCGGVDIKVYEGIYDSPHIIVYCDCGAQGAAVMAEAEAITLWNTRTNYQTNHEEKL